MTFYVHQTIALSEQTREAWKQHGGVIMRMHRTLDESIDIALSAGAEFLINCGSRMPTPEGLPPGWLWNRGEMIQRIGYPGGFRATFPDLAIPRPETFPATVWLKAPGHGGMGKTQIITNGELILPESWDWQQHIEGDEYRVMTVGDKLVQGFKREGENGARTYTWTGTTNLPDPIRATVRSALRVLAELAYLKQSVIAWDVIRIEHMDDSVQCHIFEANSSPGLSAPTARRILDQIQVQREEIANAS